MFVRGMISRPIYEVTCLKLWHDMARRLTQDIPVWQVVFMAFLGFDIAITSIAPASVEANDISAGALLVVVFIASIFLLTRTFMTRIASGHQQLKPVSANPAPVSPGLLKMYRIALPVMRYGVFVIIWLALTGGFSSLVDYLLPSFSSDQDIGIPSQDLNVWAAAGIAFLGCLEEYWRWSMIVVLLMGVKWAAAAKWATSARFRTLSLVGAVAASSLVFGLAHYQEFSSYKAWSFIVLGIMGALLALAAILTRRFLVAVLIHYTYDFLAISNLYSVVGPYLVITALVLLAVAVPGFLVLLAKVRPALPSAQVEPTE